MTKRIKSILALGLAAFLLFACAACGPNDPAPTSAPETTTEEPAINVVVTTEPEETSTQEPTTEEPTTEVATTTAETTTGAPKSKAEIVKYVNEVMAALREKRPGYSMRERTHIDGDGITSSKNAIQVLGRGVINLAKNIFTKWTDPSVKGTDNDHKGVNPKTELQNSWVKSASCTDNGNTYSIRVNLVDEKVPTLPVNEKDTMHGKITMVQTKGGFEGGAGQVGITFSKAEITYSGSYIDLTINKATGLPQKIVAYTNYKLDMIADLFGGVDVVIPLANEKEFTIKESL